ncbi:MAG: thioredoxin family protein [Planctomycetaceae bacterium]
MSNRFLLSVVICSLAACGCGEQSDSATGSVGQDDQNSGLPQTVAPMPGAASMELSDSAGASAVVPATRLTDIDETAVTAAEGSHKSDREPIYDTETPGDELIAAALRRAQRDHKHVLIEWGGNWCGWCYKLHDVFHNDQTVQPIVFEEYELVLVDEGNNHDLMLHYGGSDRQYAYPHLTVLDAEGNVLTNQETGSLEVGPKHDPEKVAAFLREWAPKKVDADELLTAALQQAAREDKHVLLRVGTPYCGWCKVLAQFIQDHDTLFDKDYVDIKIDTMRMTNGGEVADRFAPEEPGGVPWFVILDATGSVVATSHGPEGNVGYPHQPNEIAHFISMLRDTGSHLTDDDLSVIEADPTAYRTKREVKTN